MLRFTKKSYFVIVPLVITLLMLGFGLIRFSSIDDLYFISIAESFKTNAHSEHLFFISVILGYVLRFLYGIITALNWLCVFEILAASLVFISLHKIVSDNGYSIIAFFVLVALQVFVLNNITYTALSFMLPVTGAIWALNYTDKLDKSAIKHLIYALFLMTSGFLFRYSNTFYCVALLLLPLIVLGIKDKRKSFSVVAVILVLCFASSFAVISAERAYNSRKTEPQYFYEFWEYRDEAYDYERADYEEHKEELQSVGISKYDLALLQHALYADKNVYTPQVLKTVAECKDLKTNYETNPLNILDSVNKSADFYSNFIYIFSALAILSFIFIKNRRWETAATFLAVAANIGYLFIRKRGLARVYNPIAICGIFILVFLYMLEKDEVYSFAKKIFKRSNIKRTVLVIFAVVTFSFCSVNLYMSISDAPQVSSAVDEIKSDSEHVYVAHAWARNYMHDRRLTVLRKNFDSVPVLVTMGEWYVYSNYWNDYLEQNGLRDYIDSPYLYLLEDNVLYLTEFNFHSTYIKEFFRENYQLNVECKEVKKLNDDRNIKTYYVYDFDIVE